MDKERVGNMSIYTTVPDADVKEKKPEQSEITQAVQTKTYTQEEVLAMLAQIQKGETK